MYLFYICLFICLFICLQYNILLLYFPIKIFSEINVLYFVVIFITAPFPLISNHFCNEKVAL